jgi:hypothetical protein
MSDMLLAIPLGARSGVQDCGHTGYDHGQCALAGLCLTAARALNVAVPKIRRSRDWCATGGIQHRSQGRDEGEARLLHAVYLSTVSTGALAV